MSCCYCRFFSGLFSIFTLVPTMCSSCSYNGCCSRILLSRSSCAYLQCLSGVTTPARQHTLHTCSIKSGTQSSVITHQRGVTSKSNVCKRVRAVGSNLVLMHVCVQWANMACTQTLAIKPHICLNIYATRDCGVCFANLVAKEDQESVLRAWGRPAGSSP